MNKHILVANLAALITTAAMAQSPAGAPATSAQRVEQLVKGKGASPSAADAVLVHYRGTLANGTEFDSSYKRGEPIRFQLNRVIPCWTQGVQTMAVGGKARLTCPPELAYGARGVPGVIPPNSTLTFEVELLGIGAN